jgi:uncharacterized protein DUF5335
MTATIIEIDRNAWQSELDRLTWQHEGDYVTIEVMDASLGDQVEVERLPFAYATYDHKADTVVVLGRAATSARVRGDGSWPSGDHRPLHRWPLRMHTSPTPATSASL